MRMFGQRKLDSREDFKVSGNPSTRSKIPKLHRTLRKHGRADAKRELETEVETLDDPPVLTQQDLDAKQYFEDFAALDALAWWNTADHDWPLLDDF